MLNHEGTIAQSHCGAASGQQTREHARHREEDVHGDSDVVLGFAGGEVVEGEADGEQQADDDGADAQTQTHEGVLASAPLLAHDQARNWNRTHPVRARV